MATPTSVANDAKKADELIKSLSNRNPEGQNPPAPQDPAPQPSAQQQQEPPRERDPNPEPAPRTQAPDASGQQHDWKERFTNLQRANTEKFNSLREELEAGKKRELELQQKLAELQNAPAREADRSYLTADDIELVGEENLVLIERIAERRAQDLVAREMERFRLEQDQRTTQTQQQTNQKAIAVAIRDQLRGLIDDFDEVDTSKEFADWMGGADPYSGTPRKTLLSRAFAAGDVYRIASFYNEFKAEKNPPDPRQNRVMPRQSGVMDSTDQQPNKRIWTRPEISAFYHDVSMGRYRGREADKRAIEQDIADAQRTGRIR